MNGILLFLAVFLLICLYMTLPKKPFGGGFAPFEGLYVAHRGLHTEDLTVPENSLPAFAAAAEAGYGIELDLQLSKDGEVMVFHDDSLKRVCGEQGLIWERTREQLSKLRLCGSGETIPTFRQVLELVAGRSPLIVELKHGPRRDELCKKAYDLLRGYSGRYCIESFDPLVVRWFKKHAPGVCRGQLITQVDGYGLSTKTVPPLLLAAGFCNFLSRPNFIAHNQGRKLLTVRLAELLGAKRVTWTVREEGEALSSDCIIFEFFRPDTHYHKKRRGAKEQA